ncbi:SDR family NAD(P)-dependent oxidoreductase [Chakrabartia godavariana]|nr:SDR family NAD(P)-dependent oxidoreductase [Chakrabartia godavariana]
MQLAGKTILLTGGTDGIGRELALQLKAKGAKAILTGRNPERVAAMQALGFDVITADLSTKAGLETVLDAVKSAPIDVLINNAGMGTTHDFRQEMPNLDTDDDCIFLNVNAPIHLITRLMPTLRARPEAMIVNVTSGLAIAPSTGAPVYCATKAGLRSYTLALRAQLADTNIHVVEALPPMVATKMTDGMNGSKMAAPECARQIITAMERNAKEANIGIVKILQVMNSISPALVRKIMLRF